MPEVAAPALGTAKLGVSLFLLLISDRQELVSYGFNSNGRILPIYLSDHPWRFAPTRSPYELQDCFP